jgi:16S rRNA (guanine527-N7)-methyltransferase
MTKEEFIVQIKKTFPNVDSSFFSQIEVYKDFLRKTNQTLNLTRLDKEEKIYGEYFFESIFPFSFLDFSKPLSLLDIGSGSGIPGIVLKILFPQIKLTIIESSNKKVSFLKLLCDTLKIEATIL